MQYVNIRRLKNFVLDQLDAQSCLRELILVEGEDRLHPLEFVGKIRPWLRAMEIDGFYQQQSARNEMPAWGSRKTDLKRNAERADMNRRGGAYA